MKITASIVLLIAAVSLLTGCGVQPPLVVRYDQTKEIPAGQKDSYGLHVTNSSEATIHGVTFHCDQNGTKTSTVAIDTIPAHETVHLDVFRLNQLSQQLGIQVGSARTITITCSGFAHPLPITWSTNR